MKNEQITKRTRRRPLPAKQLDAYDLPPEIPLDPAKMKANRFAGRVKFSHGGKRAGAGRKSAPEALERHTVTLLKSQADYLRSLDMSLSKAIRALIERSR